MGTKVPSERASCPQGMHCGAGEMGTDASWMSMENDQRCCAVCGESVRHGTHRVNCPRRGPEFKANDSEATTLPQPERAREQEHGRKAGEVRRRVWPGPATPAQYGESRIARTPMSSGETVHSLGARLYSDAIGMHGIGFLPGYALTDGRCSMRALKDMNGAPTLR
jgi:hypothetical protein